MNIKMHIILIRIINFNICVCEYNRKFSEFKILISFAFLFLQIITKKLYFICEIYF